MMVSTSPAPLRRNAAALSYSGDVKHATPCSKVGNSITTNRWNLSGPSMIWKRPPRASTLPPNLAMMPGTRSVYFLYSTGSLIFERATQYAGMHSSILGRHHPRKADDPVSAVAAIGFTGCPAFAGHDKP